MLCYDINGKVNEFMKMLFFPAFYDIWNLFSIYNFQQEADHLVILHNKWTQAVTVCDNITFPVICWKDRMDISGLFSTFSYF